MNNNNKNQKDAIVPIAPIAPIAVNTSVPIFYIDTINQVVQKNGTRKEVDVGTRGPYTLADIIHFAQLPRLNGFQPNGNFVTTWIVYPAKSDENTTGLDATIIDIKDPKAPQTLQQSILDYHAAEDKKTYTDRLEKLAIKAMTDQERIEYEQKDIKNFNDWIQENVNTTFALPQDQNTLKLHYESKLDFIGYLLTVELGFFIASEMKALPLPQVTQTVKDAWLGGTVVTDKFRDIIDIIKQTGNPISMFYYKTYHLLKSLCFVLHDKPVDLFAPVLYNTMKARFDKQLPPQANAYSNAFIQLWEIWRKGFDVNTTSMTAKVTQSRCHKTIKELTESFEQFIHVVEGILVPKKIVTFAVPYSSFEFEKTQEDLKSALRFYNFGLSDAVGNDKYIKDLEKGPIYPNTCAQQDAAPNDKKGTILEVVEDTYSQPDQHPVHRYTVNITGNPSKTTFSIEPQRFGDVSIFCKQQEPKPMFLYYAAIDYFDDAVKSVIASQHATIFAESFPKVPQDLHVIIDEGVTKILFAVITDRISQNETIPLISGIVPSMHESARGKKTFSLKSLLYKMNWLKTKDNNPTLQTAVFILLATFAKELGDQSKIQVIENICRNQQGSQKSYVATVDSFFSESIVNGGVLFKGGNLILTEQSGFHALTQGEIEKLFEIMVKARTYTYAQFRNRATILSNIIKHVAQSAIENANTKIPFTTYLIYHALFNEVDIDKIIVPESQYNAFIGKFDRANHSSILDEESLVRRLFNFGTINDIFAIYENHTNDPFSMTIVDKMRRTDLWDMIIDYMKLGFSVDALLEETPLFFLIEMIPKLKRIEYKIGRGTSGDLTKMFLPILRQKFVDKMKAFMTTFNTTTIPINELELFIILLACNPNVGASNNNAILYSSFEPDFAAVIQQLKTQLNLDLDPLGAKELIDRFLQNGRLPQVIPPNEPKYNDVDSQQDLESDNALPSDPSNVAAAAVQQQLQSGGVKLPCHVYRKGRIDLRSYKKFLIDLSSRPKSKTRKQRKSSKSKRKSLKKRK